MAKFKPMTIDKGFSCRFRWKTSLMPGTLEFAIHTWWKSGLDMSIFEGNTAMMSLKYPRIDSRSRSGASLKTELFHHAVSILIFL